MATPITQLQNLPAAVPMVDVLAEESNEVWINVSTDHSQAAFRF